MVFRVPLHFIEANYFILILIYFFVFAQKYQRVSESGSLTNFQPLSLIATLIVKRHFDT